MERLLILTGAAGAIFVGLLAAVWYLLADLAAGPEFLVGSCVVAALGGAMLYFALQMEFPALAPAVEADPVGALPNTPAAQAYTVLVIIGSVVGTIMAMQSATVITGSGTQWTGAAIAIAAAVVARIVRRTVPTWVRVVAILAAVLSLVNVIYLEKQLNDDRADISNIFNG